MYGIGNHGLKPKMTQQSSFEYGTTILHLLVFALKLIRKTISDFSIVLFKNFKKIKEAGMWPCKKCAVAHIRES